MSAADPSSVEPLFPEAGPLQEPALALLRETGALGGQLHPITRRSVADLLRAINSYHSNLIEGHDTRPRDIERALSGAFSTSPERRALQLEARAHVDVQRLVEKRLDGEPSLAITGAEFLCFIHSEFYERMPGEGPRILSQLVRERLLVSDTPKGPVRVGFPMSVVGFYFPQLFPEDVLD